MGAISNLVQEFTVTTGAGLTVALTSLPGFARFSRHSVGAVVHYIIEDGTSWEVGQGTVQAGNTFDRTTVEETFVGGVLTTVTPAKIALSGSALVRVVASNSFIATLVTKAANLSDLASAATARTNLGLGSVDNTSDANKPVSTAQQTALNLKLDAAAYTAADVFAKVLTQDGLTSGLVAQLAAYANDSDLLDGQSSAYYTDIAARLGYTPANRAGDAFTGPVAVLGASSGTLSQGLYFNWDRGTGTGTSFLMNHKGSGAGAMAFGDISSANVFTEWARIVASGSYALLGVGYNNPLAVIHARYQTAPGAVADMFRVDFDANWSLRLIQNYVGAGDIKYQLKQVANSVEYTPLEFKAGDIYVGGTLTRGGVPEKNFFAGSLAITDPFLSLKDGTIASPDTDATYRKPIVYVERYANNSSTTKESDWSNDLMRPAILAEMVAFGDERGAPTPFVGRSYTASPTRNAYADTCFMLGAAMLAQSNAGTWSVTSLTRSGATASATTSVAHGRSTGDRIEIAGAAQAEYNIEASITVTSTTTFDYTITGTPATPATGTITAYGVNRDCFATNFVASFPSGNKPRNLVGIEVDLIPSISCANVRPGTGTTDNFTAFWAQSAGGTTTCNTAFYASDTGAGGWFYGLVVDASVHANLAFLKTDVDASTAKGLYVETRWQNSAGRVIEAWCNGSEQFRVDGDPSNAVSIRVNGVMRLIEVGAIDSGGTNYRMLRVLN